jgi:hypothetical protein
MTSCPIDWRWSLSSKEKDAATYYRSRTRSGPQQFKAMINKVFKLMIICLL